MQLVASTFIITALVMLTGPSTFMPPPAPAAMQLASPPVPGDIATPTTPPAPRHVCVGSVCVGCSSEPDLGSKGHTTCWLVTPLGYCMVDKDLAAPPGEGWSGSCKGAGSGEICIGEHCVECRVNTSAPVPHTSCWVSGPGWQCNQICWTEGCYGWLCIHKP